jgi:hypothetical protein
VTREEFAKLSTPEMLVQIWSLLQERGVPISGPPAGGTGDGREPKYDTSIARKDGMVQYASECSLKELSYWYEQFGKPPRDPKYAESNQKQRKALGYWIAYRQANPDAAWTGERNKVQITAAAPSDKPQQYPRGVTASAPTTPTPRFNDEGGASDMDDIPFAPADRWG